MSTPEIELKIEKIKQHSRNYAKRQVTWLKREKDIIWIDMPTKTELILESIIHLLNKNETLP